MWRLIFQTIVALRRHFWRSWFQKTHFVLFLVVYQTKAQARYSELKESKYTMYSETSVSRPPKPMYSETCALRPPTHIYSETCVLWRPTTTYSETCVLWPPAPVFYTPNLIPMDWGLWILGWPPKECRVLQEIIAKTVLHKLLTHPRNVHCTFSMLSKKMESYLWPETFVMIHCKT